MGWDAFIQIVFAAAVVIGIVLFLGARLIRAERAAADATKRIYDEQLKREERGIAFYERAYERVAADSNTIVGQLHESVRATIEHTAAVSAEQSRVANRSVESLVKSVGATNLGTLRIAAALSGADELPPETAPILETDNDPNEIETTTPNLMAEAT